jgi:Domain of unknown function (DUF4296)
MNYLKIIIKINLALVWMSLIQCTKSVNLPVNENMMSIVLTDIHIAEAAVDNESGDMKDSITRLYYPQIFEHHGIQQWQFDSSMSMISKNPTQMSRIYKKVLQNIQEKNKTDSLTKVK